MSEWNYIIAAYALTWITLLGYAAHLARRLRRAAADVVRVDEAVSETERTA